VTLGSVGVGTNVTEDLLVKLHREDGGRMVLRNVGILP
jgi:hypothetical protein